MRRTAKPADLNRRAAAVVAQVTGSSDEREKNPEAVTRGRLGGLKRAERTSPEERRRDAQRAVQARWEKAANDQDRQDGVALCPHCGGRGSFPRVPQCPPCSGTGQLTATRAVELYLVTRRRLANVERRRRAQAAEILRLRALIDDFAKGGWQKHREGKLQGLERTVRAQSDRILTLNVELARATGAELERLIPHGPSRERALRLSMDREAT